MTKIIVGKTGTIDIGFFGENEHRVICFQESASLLKEYPNAAVTVLHQRNGDDCAYPVDGKYIKTDNGIVEWMIQSGDVAKAGRGHCELVFTENGTVAKTVIYTTLSRSSLNGTGEAPDPIQDWMTSIIDQIAQMSQQMESITEAISSVPSMDYFTCSELARLELVIMAEPDVHYGLPVVTKEKTGHKPEDGEIVFIRMMADIRAIGNVRYYIVYDLWRTDGEYEIEDPEDSYLISNLRFDYPAGTVLFEKDRVYAFRYRKNAGFEALNYANPTV